MRSIICISALGLAIACGSAQADLLDTLPDGCFARTYDVAHLDRTPSQHIEAIAVDFILLPDTSAGVEVIARLTNRARTGENGQPGEIMLGSAYCSHAEEPWTCFQTCEGGGEFVIVSQSEDQIEIAIEETFVLDREDRCAQRADLAEPGQERTVYRLYKAPPSACLRN